MSVSVKQFLMYCVDISDDIDDSDGRGHKACMFYAQFSSLRFINDSRYSEGVRSCRLTKTQVEQRLMSNL